MKENLFIRQSKRVVLLLCLFSTFLFAKYQAIYNFEDSEFVYHEIDGKYKVVLTTNDYISKNAYGFKLFIPVFIEDFSLEMLRVGSIGHFSGLLFVNRDFKEKDILNVNSYDINYFLTDYKQKDLRQLDYLLQHKVIPYKKKTSLVLEAYNLPKRVSKKLDKWIYFKFLRQENIRGLTYAFSMTFDKKTIDTFVKKKRFKLIKDTTSDYFYIHTFMKNLSMKKRYYKSKSTNKKVYKQKEKKAEKKVVKTTPSYRLDIKRVYQAKKINGRYLSKKELLEFINYSDSQEQKAIAFYNLGVYYSKINTNSANKKAIEYFKKSNIKEANFNLGIYYYIGLSIKENDKQAYKYFNKSSKQGFVRASKNIEIMNKYKIGIY